MYVVVQHQHQGPARPRSRAASGSSRTRARPPASGCLQFYPARDGSGVTCLWEADSVDDVQGYVDATLGDSSENIVLRGRRRAGVRAATFQDS